MSKLPLILASCLTASALAATLSAQRGTDFSGRWVLDEAQARPPADIPQRLVVQQSDAAFTPQTLYVERHVGDAVQEHAFRIGLIGGTVNGPQPTGGSRHEVTWRGDVLWIYQETYGAGRANFRRRGETWRIDERGRLVISIETRDNDDGAVTRTFAYRREKQ